MDVLSPFPSGDPAISALNILSVLMMYGPFYLANTGAMLFGKWIPEKLGFSSITIDGGRNWKDGFRLLGDGKTWNGLLGGAVFSWPVDHVRTLPLVRRAIAGCASVC